MKVFRDVLDILSYACDRLPESEQQEIYKQLDQSIGKSHEADQILEK